MAEYCTDNSLVGEDWECECYDLADHVVQTGNNVSFLLQSESSSSKRDDVNGESNQVLSSACLESELLSDMAEQNTDDQFVYVTDNKKVFVSNINYRVRISVVCVWCVLMIIDPHPSFICP